VRSVAVRAAGVGLLVVLVPGCRSEQEAAVIEDRIEQPTDLQAKPDPASFVAPDRGEPPTELTVTDLVVGEGAAATAGDRLTVHYVGVSWSDGRQFDASWDRGPTFDFVLGAGRVIPGWEQGVLGMRVGGRRMLTIPPDLAYGERGAAGAIGPNETLVFVVDLLEVS
jgi:peptidylprolyl isomerase